MMQFGAGALFGTRNDISGQQPMRFGVLQDVQFDFSFTEKELMGGNQLPVFVARGQGKYTGKAKVGTISAKLFNSIFFGQLLTTGQLVAAVDEPHAVPTTSPFTISANNAATFSTDEGVSYAGPLGLPLTMTPGAPSAIGQYEPSTTGLYTFSSSDAGTQVLLNYLYAVTTGEKIALTNQQLGTTPTFSGVFRNRDPQSGLYMTLVINKMTCSKLTLASKTSDFTIPEFDITIMDDGTGSIGTLSFGDLS